MSLVVGWAQHGAAVEALRESFRAIPSGAPVRLAKPTTNLFRTRAGSTTTGLDVSGLGSVIAVDVTASTADVQGMCTYEALVEATLAHQLIPMVVPQLRTITLGGAVTGMGIESTSFRNGLPHESVLEMDIFTGAGEVVTVRPGDDLFDAFPNSYGSLGYATRLKIRLEPAPSHVHLRHIRFEDPQVLAKTFATIAETGEYDGSPVHGLDGVAFSPTQCYATVATWTDGPQGPVSDYTGQQIYFRSIQQRETDNLTIADYIWRWDTDWFWCSGAFGAQNPTLRRFWPKRWRRSDVYMKLLSLDRRFGIADRLDKRAGRPLRERVVQDVEVPVERMAEFLEWFDDRVGMRPVWLCPLISHGVGDTGRGWPHYPLEPGRIYVNAGFWGTVHVGPERDQSPTNRAIEAFLPELEGHKSLYSEAFYSAEDFNKLYDTDGLEQVKDRHDPDHRLTTLFDKVVRQQ